MLLIINHIRDIQAYTVFMWDTNMMFIHIEGTDAAVNLCVCASFLFSVASPPTLSAIVVVLLDVCMQHGGSSCIQVWQHKKIATLHTGSSVKSSGQSAMA